MRTVSSYGSPAARWDQQHETPRALTILRALEPMEARCDRCQIRYADRGVRVAFATLTLPVRMCTACVKVLSGRIENRTSA